MPYPTSSNAASGYASHADDHNEPRLPRLTLLGQPKTPPMSAHQMPPLPAMPAMPPMPAQYQAPAPPQAPFMGHRGRSNTGGSSVYPHSVASTPSRNSSLTSDGHSPSSSRTSASEFDGSAPRPLSPRGYKPGPAQQQQPPRQQPPAQGPPPTFPGPIDWSQEYTPPPNPFGNPFDNRAPPRSQSPYGQRPQPPYAQGPPRSQSPNGRPRPPYAQGPPRPQSPNGRPMPPYAQRGPRPQSPDGRPRPPYAQHGPRPQSPDGRPRPPFAQGPPRPHSPNGRPRPPYAQGPPRPQSPNGRPMPPYAQRGPRPQSPDGRPRPPFAQGPPRPQSPNGRPQPPFAQHPQRPQSPYGDRMPRPQSPVERAPQPLDAPKPSPLRVRKESPPPSQDMSVAPLSRHMPSASTSSRAPRHDDRVAPAATEQPALRRLESRYFKDDRQSMKPQQKTHSSLQDMMPAKDSIIRTNSAPIRQTVLYSQEQADNQAPVTPGEISLVWQHASLLFHNNRSSEALSTFHSLQTRQGIPNHVAARISLNIGIISTSMAHEASDPRNNKSAAAKKDESEQAYYLATEAFHAAINKEPGGFVGAAGTFLLGCAMFDAGHYAKAAECFEMCESVFVSEGWAPDDTARYAPVDEEVDLTPIGLKHKLRLRDIRANYKVCQERERIPQGLGTNRSLVRVPTNLLAETYDGEDLSSPHLGANPIAELDATGLIGEIEIGLENVSPIAFSQSRNVLASPVSPPTPHAPTIPGLSAPKGPPRRPARPDDMSASGTRSTANMSEQERRAAEAERARKKRDRQTRLLIKLGDLRLNKPLPPLPAGARESDWRHVPRSIDIADAPPVPALPSSSQMKFM